MRTLAALALAVSAAVAPVVTMPATANAATTTTSWTTLKVGSVSPAVYTARVRLNALGYYNGTPSTTYTQQTAQAVMALQKVAGLSRDGILGPMTKGALDRGVRPTARTNVPHAIEVDKARQVLKVVDYGVVKKTFNVSTGGNYYYYYSGGVRQYAYTPTGSFNVWYVYSYAPVWQYGTLGAMYRPYYFKGGVAIHGSSYSAVGAYPASHGCVRIAPPNIDWLVNSGNLKKYTNVVVY